MSDWRAYVRLSPSQLKRAGLKPKSRRYISPEGALISARQYENLKAGGITKERATKARKAGALPYRTQQAHDNALYQAKAFPVRKTVTGITPADTRVIVKKLTAGWHGLSPADKQRFHDLFRRYDAEEVRDAAGSPSGMEKAA